MTATTTLSDRQRAALAGLVRDHQARLRAFLCRFLADPDEIDEVLQDVFIGVLSRCEELAARDEHEAAKYLRGVARNLVRLRWRRGRQRREQASDAIEDLVADRLERRLDEDDDADDHRDHLPALRACLDQLGGRARELVERHFFEQVPLVDIARDSEQKPSAVRMAMLRIRRQLRRCIEGRGRGRPEGSAT